METKNNFNTLIDYCVLGHDLGILDQDAIMRRVETWCKDTGNEAMAATIIKAVIEKSLRISTLKTSTLFVLCCQADTSPWGELLSAVLVEECKRRDRALGIAQ